MQIYINDTLHTAEIGWQDKPVTLRLAGNGIYTALDFTINSDWALRILDASAEEIAALRDAGFPIQGGSRGR